MRIREPVVAGQFYSGVESACRGDLERLLSSEGTLSAQNIGIETQAAKTRPTPRAEVRNAMGGLVPHAGWMYSGAVAAKVFAALADGPRRDVVILFGGVHRYHGKEAAMFGSGIWETPIGPVEVDARLAERVLGHTNLIVDDPYAHEEEHSIEVQLPFVRHLFPEVKMLPIMVPPTKAAPEVGEAVARTIASYKYDALIVGTTDLTHYGPRYGFAPKGLGAEAHRWAKEQNDRRFIDLVCRMRDEELVPEAAARFNACSSGAAAATVAACAALGATRATLLAHTTSGEVMMGEGEPLSSDFVGYAGIVFFRDETASAAKPT